MVPHLSTFGKAMGNGFAISALAGKREIMRLGGLDHDQPRVFLLSTTHGAETHALAAALETIKVYREQNVVDFLWRQGERLRALVDQSIAENRLEGFFELLGSPATWYLGLAIRTVTFAGLPYSVHAGVDPARSDRAVVRCKFLA